MNNFLRHPIRIALTLVGFLCALSAFTFFGAPVMVIPFIPIIFQFIASSQKSLVVVGWLLLFLTIASFVADRIEIEGFRFEKLVIYGGPSLLLLAGLHLMVSESRKDRTANPQ